MEVQESKSTETKESVEDISDYYIKRRTVDTTKPKYLTVDNIEITKDNEIAIKSKLGGIDIAIILGKNRQGIENIDNQSNINYFFNNIASYNYSYNEEHIVGSEFKSYISDDLKKLGIKKDEFMYDIKLYDDIEIKDNKSDIFKNVGIWNSYVSAKGNKSAWIHDIEEINSLEKKGKFELVIEPIKDHKLSWNLDVPFQSDIKRNPLALLIENEGSGDPENLEEFGEVVVMHTSDVAEDIDIIGLDTTEEWVLLTKEQFDIMEYETLPSIPSLMETLDYFGNASLMGLISIALLFNFLNIISEPGLELYYIPTMLALALCVGMTVFLLVSSMKLPKSKFKNYLSN